MELSRQEYCSGLPFSFPGDLPNPRIKPQSPALQADFHLPTVGPTLLIQAYFIMKCLNSSCTWWLLYWKWKTEWFSGSRGLDVITSWGGLTSKPRLMTVWWLGANVHCHCQHHQTVSYYILLSQERSKFKVQFRLNASLLHHVKFKNTKLNHHQSGTISVILWKYSSQRGRLKTGDGGGGGLVAKSRPTLATPWTVACRGLLCLWESLEWVAISFSKRGDNRGERALSIINQCSIIINLLTP